MALHIPHLTVNDRPVFSEDPRTDAKSSPADLSYCEETFRPLYMVKIFSFHWLVSIGVVATGIYLSVYPLNILQCNTYHVIVYLQLGFWVGTYMINELIKPSCSKMKKYKELNKNMTLYRKMPLQIVSLWNTVLLVTQKYVTENMKITKTPTGPGCDPVEGPPQIFIIIFCGLQTAALTVFYIPALFYLIGARNYAHQPASQPVQLPTVAEIVPDCLPENPIMAAAASVQVPVTLSVSSNRDVESLPSPRSLLEVPCNEQLRTYAHWFKAAQIKNERLWRQAKKLGIKREDLPTSDRTENNTQ